MQNSAGSESESTGRKIDQTDMALSVAMMAMARQLAATVGFDLKVYILTLDTISEVMVKEGAPVGAEHLRQMAEMLKGEL